MASLSGQSGSNGGQPYYDPQRGFVYLSSNVTDAPAATTYDQPIEDDDQNLDEIERELYQGGSYGHEQTTEDANYELMAQMEAEMRAEDERVHNISNNDKLILQQTWFPESRNCATCQGFKYASQFTSGQCPDCKDATSTAPSTTDKKG